MAGPTPLALGSHRARDHRYPTGPAAVTATLDDDSMAAALDRVHHTAAVIREDTEFLPAPGPRCGHCPWQPSCPEGQAWSG